MYGIVSAVDWVIIKLVSSSDNNSEGKVDVLLQVAQANRMMTNHQRTKRWTVSWTLKYFYGSLILLILKNSFWAWRTRDRNFPYYSIAIGTLAFQEHHGWSNIRKEESISGERGSQRVKGTTPDNSSEVFESSDSKTDQQRDKEARSQNETVKANQTEILCWSSFIVGLGKSVDEIVIKEKVFNIKLSNKFFLTYYSFWTLGLTKVKMVLRVV
ncbi:hypothetical protein RhiirA4_425708 [Rhizophagus irregularis]|uniref:Uncharacterized protein n=1 Tax=Rhizophagus irregularis TaxID=588596 RepID=A0A2I1H295_9GLOM|nr:hypothetical protein RhiirA4_425708 [Rhizophagus irregularis]